MTKKIITQEDYDKLPGNGAVQILNAVGDDGQPILKYAKAKFKDGSDAIIKYWIDEKGDPWKISHKFIPDNEY